MKILFDHPEPFLLMHGGFQIQVEQTKLALERVGVEVECLRWWDATQRGDILHFFGRPRLPYIQFAQQKGIKVVMSHLLTALGSRPAWRREVQKRVIHAASRLLPGMVTAPFGWQAYRTVDAAVMLTPWEAQLMREIFAVPPERLHVVPNGVEDVFRQTQPTKRGPWLVCTTTITPRKRVLELARAAVEAGTPLWVIGKPYADADPYAQAFVDLSRKHPGLVKYAGPIQDRAALAKAYREARGFVLLSREESLSLSALEASACECPLLLSDLPWARTVFKSGASYCPVTPDLRRTAGALRQFHDAAPNLPPPPKPLTWEEVAGELKSLYAGLLAR